MKFALGVISFGLVALPASAVVADPTEVLNSSYTIFTLTGNGAGFVTDGGYVVTAQHVTDGSATVKIVASLPSTETVVGDVIWEDAKRDVAIIEPRQTLVGTPLTIATVAPKVGTTVYAIGSPIRSTVLSRGTVTNSLDADGYLEAKIGIDHGNSGGPLFDANEQVVGMVDAMSTDGQKTAFAVPADEISVVLQDAKDNKSGGIIPVHIPKSIIGKATFYTVALALALAVIFLIVSIRRKLHRRSQEIWVSSKAITISIENEE